MPDQNFAIPGLQALQSPVSDSLTPFLELPSHSASTTQWIGMNAIGPVTDDGDPMPNPAAVATLEFSQRQLTAEVTPFLVLSSEDAEIVITDAATWLFEVPAQPLELDFGHWYWTFKVTDSEGNVYRLFEGSIIIRP